jgi:hypothetical protein
VLKQGLTPEELVKEFKHLNLSQVYDTLSYYYDYPAEFFENYSVSRLGAVQKYVKKPSRLSVPARSCVSFIQSGNFVSVTPNAITILG